MRAQAHELSDFGNLHFPVTPSAVEESRFLRFGRKWQDFSATFASLAPVEMTGGGWEASLSSVEMTRDNFFMDVSLSFRA